MSMKRILWVILVAILVTIVTIGVVGCAAPAQTQMREISGFGGESGSGAYIFMFGLADVINKNSSWLRISCLEMPTSGAAMLRLSQDPGSRKNAIASFSAISDFDATRGTGQFKDYAYSGALIGRTFDGIFVWVTKDPNIKTPKDLAGKRVAVGGSKSAAPATMSEVMFEIWGIGDKVNRVYLGYAEGASALISGEVAAMTVPTMVTVLGKKHVFAPVVQEIKTAMKPNFLDFDIEQARAWMEKNKTSFSPFITPAGAGIADVDVKGVLAGNGWICDPTLDDNVVYEITRLAYEKIELFKDFHAQGAGMTRETLARIPVPAERFHKAAIKYYKEKGVPVGLEAFK